MKNIIRKFRRNSVLFDKINASSFYALNTYFQKKFLLILKRQKMLADFYAEIISDNKIELFIFNGIKIKRKNYKQMFYFLHEYLYGNFSFSDPNFLIPKKEPTFSYICSENKSGEKTDIENIYRVRNMKGLKGVQNYSSAVPVSLLPPLPNKIILDGCSAPGNKTHQLSLLTDSSNKIIAVEKNEYRFEQLKKRFEGNEKIQTVHSDFLSIFMKADYILLDVPCSGSGTDQYISKTDLALLFSNLNNKTFTNYRLPDENYSDEEISNYAQLQIKLLDHAIRLDPEFICYSTCSIFNKENINVVNLIVKKHKNISIEKIVKIEKDDEKTGFFACLLSINK